MDHCLPAENVNCRSRKDCAEREHCRLTGYSSGFRNNDDMISYCAGLTGRDPMFATDHAPEENVSYSEPDRRPTEERGPRYVLIEQVEEHARKMKSKGE